MRDSDVRPVQLHDGQCVVVDEAPAPVRCPLSRPSMARSARTWRCPTGPIGCSGPVSFGNLGTSSVGKWDNGTGHAAKRHTAGKDRTISTVRTLTVVTRFTKSRM